jgi:hypothetical protein
MAPPLLGAGDPQHPADSKDEPVKMHLLSMSIMTSAALAGCGSSSTPLQDCQAMAHASCQKLYQCDPATASAFGFANEADCEGRGYFGVSDNQADAGGCAQFSQVSNPCSAPQSYHSGNAQACATAVSTTSCAEFYPGNPTESLLDGGVINQVCGQVCE